MTRSNAKFITFEGGEGTGKTTQIKLLCQALDKINIKAVNTREPGGTEGAESIRNLLVNGDVGKWDAQVELLLHLAARFDHINKFIKPSLISSDIVISDRFTDSTIAYQAYGHGLGSEYVQQLCSLAIGNFQPDLTLILDMPVEKAIIRAGRRGETEDRYEKMGKDFHNRVREGFLKIAKANPQRCVVINADSDIESIHMNIISEVRNKLSIKLGYRE